MYIPARDEPWSIRLLNTYRESMRNTATILLFVTVVGLSIFGVVMLYSTSSADHGEVMLIKQAQWIGIGMAAAGVVYLMDYRKLCNWSAWLLLLAALPLGYLATVNVTYMCGAPASILQQFPFVRRINGAYRWLIIGPFRAQPGELAKLMIILFLAHYYGSNPRRSQQFLRGVFFPLLIVGCVVALLLLGGSLSLTMITCAVIFAVMFAAGVRMRYFLILLFTVTLLMVTVLIASPERMKRVTGSWLEPEKYRRTTGYQLTHSQYAIGSGHLWGVGLNNSRMKEGYLPFASTDFIMAIVGEELGFAGICSVMLAFLLLVGSSFWISSLACNRQGLLLGVGIGFSIGFHAFASLAVVSGALPTTGVTAPLVSYGGSSMLLTWLSIGLLGSIARVSHQEDLTETGALSRGPNDEPLPLDEALVHE